MNVHDLLSEFGKKTGLGNLKLNDDGLCRLVFDGTTAVDVEATSTGFVIHSVVGQIPSINREKFMEMLLEANGPDNVTGAAALGIDPNLNEVLLYQNFTDMTPTFAYFEKSLDEFIGEITKWKARLSADWEQSGEAIPPKRDTKPGSEPKGKTSDKPKDTGFPPPGMIKA